MSDNADKVIEQLTSLGLSVRESKLYFALLRTPEATALELDHISGIPRTKIYEVLERMTENGMCSVRKEGRKSFYRATPPQDVLDQFKSNWKKENEKLYDKADNIFTNLNGFFKKSRKTDPALEKIEIVRSKEQVQLRFHRLTTEARKEVLSLSRSPYASDSAEERETSLKVQAEAFARGIKQKTIYMDERHKFSWLEEFMLDMERIGEEVKVLDNIPFKLFLFDREIAFLALMSIPDLTGSKNSYLIVEDSGLVTALIDLFYKYWDQAKPIGN